MVYVPPLRPPAIKIGPGGSFKFFRSVVLSRGYISVCAVGSVSPHLIFTQQHGGEPLGVNIDVRLFLGKERKEKTDFNKNVIISV